MSARYIAHVDMNSYFASVEQQCNPFIRGKPVAIVRKPNEATVVTTASYEAKSYGVDTGMATWEAKRACPRLLFVVEDLNKYAHASERIFRLLEEVTPDVEVFSIDEAFLDITQAARDQGGPVAVCQWIKREIRRRLGQHIRCSIGIAPSKILAKIASESRKPDGLTWIRDAEVEHCLNQLPVNAACGIHERTKERLEALRIRTLGDLGRADPLALRRKFGLNGLYLHWMGQGKDPVPLGAATSRPRRSVGHSRVLTWPYPDLDGAKETLQLLCAKVGRRLRKLGYAGRIVHFYARSPLGFGAGRQTSLATPTADEDRIFQACESIAQGLDRDGKLPPELNGIAVSVGGLKARRGLPIQLFDADRRRERVLAAMDRVNDAWGEFAVYPASLHRVREKPDWTVASIALHRDADWQG